MGGQLPAYLEDTLPQGTTIHWVQGPYALTPKIVDFTKLNWVLHNNPDDMGAIFQQCDIALVSYGVSLFELLSYGIPTVVVSTSAGPEAEEWCQFQKQEIARAVDTPQEAVSQLAELLNNGLLCTTLQRGAMKKVDGEGGRRFSVKVAQLYSRMHDTLSSENGL